MIFKEINTAKQWMSLSSVLFWLLSCILWFIMWFNNPYSTEKPAEIITTPGIYMVLLCLVGMVISRRKMPVLMALVSVLSFLPIGWYLLGTPGIFNLIGWLNIACFILSLVMLSISKHGQNNYDENRDTGTT